MTTSARSQIIHAVTPVSLCCRKRARGWKTLRLIQLNAQPNKSLIVYRTFCVTFETAEELCRNVASTYT